MNEVFNFFFDNFEIGLFVSVDCDEECLSLYFFIKKK